MSEAGAKRKGSARARDSLAQTLQPDIILPRLKALQRKTRHPELKERIREIEADDFSVNRLSSTLMDVFRLHGSAEAYTLIYELNYRSFFLIVFSKVRYYRNFLDPKDILQDVFLSIYRYPHKFRCGKENAFRNWSFSIIRNTILKHLNARKSSEFSTELLSEIIEDKDVVNPLAALSEAETLQTVKKFYLTCLSLYMHVFEEVLAEREKQALLLVEVKGKRYREACDQLGIKLENFKMVVCRARKKIFRKMNQVLGNAAR